MDTRGAELFNELVGKIKKNIPFKFVRWGDGEWIVYFNIKRKLCDSDPKPEAQKDIRRSLYGDFIYGVQNISKKLFEIPKREWVNADIFHYASIDGRLSPLFKALKGKKIVLVGPKHLRDLKVIKVDKFIEVPPKNCWGSKERVMEELEKTDGEVYIFCCAFLTNVLIYDLDKNEKFDDKIMLDLGSLLDVYAGKPSRGYHKKMSKEIYEANLPKG